MTPVLLEDLSVIISCKNRLNNLNYCISSIFCGLGIPKVYVVDFGSTENIEFKNNARINVIRVNRNTEHFHKARAINIGIRNTATKYICVTDADQIFSPNFFMVVNKLLNKNPNYFIQCLTYGLLSTPKNITPQNVMDNYEFLINKAKNERKKKPLYGDGCCHAMTREYATNIRGYEESFIGWGYEDSDMAWRARLNKKKIIFIHSIASMLHLPHETGGKYYSSNIKIKNRNLYLSRRNRKIRIANTNNRWGIV